MCIPRGGRPPDVPAGALRMGAPDGSCFQYNGNGRAMSHIFLLNNPHFQKEFQKMMARRETVFSFSLHFAPILSKLSVDKMPENCRVPPVLSVERGKIVQEAAPVFVHYTTLRWPCDNKTEVFVHFLRMITPHSFRHGSRPSVKISTIADEERIRPPAAGLRRIIPGSVGHD